MGTTTAESTCKADNDCTDCSDFNFGDDCDANQREHCAEIECCPSCETEILSMFACEHGATCGTDLTCISNPNCGNFDNDGDGGSQGGDIFVCPDGDVLKPD